MGIQLGMIEGVHPKALQSLAKLEDYLLNADELVDQRQICSDIKLRVDRLIVLTLAPTINCIAERDLVSEIEAEYFSLGRFYGPRRCTVYYYHIEKENELKYKWAKNNLK